MLIESDINPVKLRALEDPILAPWLLNLEQNRFGTLPTFSHSGQLGTLIHRLGGKAQGLGRTQTEATFLRPISLVARNE